MPKLITQMMRAQIALVNPLLKRMDLHAMRKLQDGLGALGQRALTGSVRFVERPFDDFDAAWAEPTVRSDEKAILYLHGGAYTAGTLTYAKVFGGVLAEHTGRRVLAVGYRLAPEHPFPAALDDALTAYRDVLSAYAPGDIALVGESAGGGLCFALALAIKEANLPLPARIVALSPWADLTMSSPEVLEKTATDPVLHLEGLKLSASMYAEGCLSEPKVSPVFGDLTGLPPSLIIAGGDELLLHDAIALHDALLRSGSRAELIVEEGLWHVYPLYGVPEGKEALIRMCAFLTEVDHHG